MRPELQIILLSVKLNSTETEQNPLNKLIENIVDWDYFISKIIDRGFAPLFYKKLALIAAEVPEHIKQLLRKTYYTTVSRNMALYDAFKEITLVFKENNIEFIALKGIFLSEWLYGDIGLRQMSDIDLLIKEEDAEKAVLALEKASFRVSPFEIIVSEAADEISRSLEDKTESAHLRPMIKGIVSVELHTKLQYKSELYQQNNEKIWNSSRVVTLNGSQVRVLDFYQQLIHICLHLNRHFGVHLQFTCYSDICVFLEKFSKEIDWHHLISVCKENSYEEPVFKHILLAHEYMQAQVPEYIISLYRNTVSETDRDIFFKHLTGFDFLDVPAQSAVPTHFQTIRHIKNPLLKLRYVVEVVFPGKAFMISKYGLKSKVEGQKSEGTSSYHHIITSKFWWLWYGYCWWTGLKGLFKMVNG